MIIGSNLLHFKSLPSTNSHAAAMIKENAVKEGTVIYTNYQSAGRGHGGNKWESEENKNLLISIVLYPSMIRPPDQFLLSMSLSLGICDFLEHYTGSISIKWPNDIYVKNDKIAGILIENSVMGDLIEHSIAGIGININQEKFISDAPNPVSLKMLTGRQHDLHDCLIRLTADLGKRYQNLVTGDIEPIKSDYLNYLYRNHIWSKYRDREGIFSGRILNVSNTGELVIERENGPVNAYSFKEVEFVV